ncbi:MAG: hypothetical protein IKC01_08795, partial [Clostridia bacterium]|nr:hypothetical protein [Clostridia bacterium]
MRKNLKVLSVILLLVIVAASFSVVASAAVTTPLYSLDSSDYKISDAVSGGSRVVFKNGRATFNINLISGLYVTDALVTVKFDKDVLRIVDAGPVMKKDADGGSTESIPGLHTHGYAENDDSAYTFAYINTSGYTTGSTGKALAYVTFEVIDSSRPATTIEFIAGPHASSDVIETYSEIPTLDSCIISSITPGNKSLTLKWNSVAGAQKYRVYRKVVSSNSTGYEVLKEVTNTSFKDTAGLKNNTTYKYAVKAITSSSTSSYVEKSYTYLDPVTLSTSNVTSGIKISWKKVEGATKYKVYRRVAGASSWTGLQTVEGNVYSVTDKSIKSGVTYEYTAKAFKGESVSANAAIKTAKYVSMVSKVTLANGYNGVSVKWTAVSGAEKYRIYRRLASDNSWTAIKTVSSNVVSFVDSGATSGQTNYYAVRACSGGTWSAFKSYAINYLATPKATKTYSSIGKGNVIKWNAVAGAAQYRVYKKTPGATKWTLLSTTTKNYFVDKNVKLGKTYLYTLRAENRKNLSNYNRNGWSIQYTLTAPEITKISSSANGISIKWTTVSGADGYRLYRKTSSQTKWSLLKKTTATSYADKSAKSGVVYQYTVRAYAGSSVSSYNKKGWTGVILKTP